MEIMNLMCGGDISQGNFWDIKELYRIYSRGLEKGKTIQELVQIAMKTTSRGVS